MNVRSDAHSVVFEEGIRAHVNKVLKKYCFFVRFSLSIAPPLYLASPMCIDRTEADFRLVCCWKVKVSGSSTSMKPGPHDRAGLIDSGSNDGSILTEDGYPCLDSSFDDVTDSGSVCERLSHLGGNGGGIRETIVRSIWNYLRVGFQESEASRFAQRARNQHARGSRRLADTLPPLRNALDAV